MAEKRSHLIKFQRAQELLKELGERLEAWRQEAGKAVFGEPDAEDPRYQIFYFENAPIGRQKFSPLIGDIVRNLRASLDHLVVELAEAFTGTLSRKQEQGAKFPIHTSEGAFRAGTAELVALVGSEVGAILQRLQPCYTRPDKGPEWDLLWQLDELSLADQRRTPAVVCTVVGRWSVESILPEGFDPTGAWFRTGPPPKGRGPIARLPLLPVGTEQRVMGGVTASLDVALRDPPSPPAGNPVSFVLDDIAQYIQSRVFAALEPKLPPSSKRE